MICKVGHFFTHCGGRSWLSMCLCKHWNITIILSQFCNCRNKALHQWKDLKHILQPNLLINTNLTAQRFLHHQTIGQVIDVFRRATKMSELQNLVQFTILTKDIFKEVFHSFDIMIGCPLIILDLSKQLSHKKSQLVTLFVHLPA